MKRSVAGAALPPAGPECNYPIHPSQIGERDSWNCCIPNWRLLTARRVPSLTLGGLRRADPASFVISIPHHQLPLKLRLRKVYSVKAEFSPSHRERGEDGKYCPRMFHIPAALPAHALPSHLFISLNQPSCLYTSPLRPCLPSLPPTSCPLLLGTCPTPAPPVKTREAPRGRRQHCHSGPALREDEAGKSESEKGSGRRRRR